MRLLCGALIVVLASGAAVQAAPPAPPVPPGLQAGGDVGSSMVSGRTLLARSQDKVNILDYGAKCDGRLVSVPGALTKWHGTAADKTTATLPGWVPQPLTYYSGTDDTAAIGRALGAALTQNKPLYIPGSYPGTSGATGYCLMKSGDPLGQSGASTGMITGPLTIEGDGRDVSRLVQFADNPGGSVASVAVAGSGYAVGDVVAVMDASATPAPGMLIEVVAVNGNGGVTDVVPVGDPSFSVIPGANAATESSCNGFTQQPGCSNGTGAGLRVNVVVGGVGIATPAQTTFSARINGIALRNFSIIATGQQNPGQAVLCGDPISLWSVNDIAVDGVGVDYSRCISLSSRQSQNTVITRNRIRWSARDMINVASSRVVVSNNTLEHGGDDAIATPDQPAESGAEPFREGVVISGNFITDAAGIDVRGGVSVSITGNTLVRPKDSGITVASGGGTNEGATPMRSVVITGNSITDIHSVPGDPIFSGTINKCIIVGSEEPIVGVIGTTAGVGVPGGMSASVPGVVVSPYEVNLAGTMGWPLMVNGTYSPAVASTAPTASGIGMVISGNTCVRSLPTDSTEWFSTLGFGSTYGGAGWLDFLLSPDTAFGTMCFDAENGTLLSVRFTDNVCSGAKWGLSVEPGAHVYDMTVEANTWRDLRNYGISMSGAPGGQSITFIGNTWDLDPYFSSPNRVVSGVTTEASFSATIAGNQMTVSAPVTGNILPGQTVRGTGVPQGAVVQAYTPCPKTGACTFGQGAAGTYTLAVSGTVSAAEVMSSGQAIYTGAWNTGSPGVPNLFNGLPTQGLQFLGNRVLNAPFIGSIGANDRQAGNQYYARINSDGSMAGVGGGAYFAFSYPVLSSGWEQIQQDSDPRSSTYGQILGATNNATQLLISTVSTLPTCNSASKSLVQTVSDATAPAYNVALTGGGAVTTMALCNGTAWVAH